MSVSLLSAVRMPLSLEPYGSVFVVFRSPPRSHLVRLSGDGKLLFPVSPPPPSWPAVEFVNGFPSLLAATPGHFQMVASDGKQWSVKCDSETLVQPLEGAWEVEG